MNPIEVAKQKFHADIEVSGWYSHGDDEGPCIYTSNAGIPGFAEAMNEFLAAAAAELFPGRSLHAEYRGDPREVSNIWRFNDDPETTLADADAVYDRAAGLYEASVR